MKKSSARVGRSTTERATTMAMKKAMKAAHLKRKGGRQSLARQGRFPIAREKGKEREGREGGVKGEGKTHNARPPLTPSLK